VSGQGGQAPAAPASVIASQSGDATPNLVEHRVSLRYVVATGGFVNALDVISRHASELGGEVSESTTQQAGGRLGGHLTVRVPAVPSGQLIQLVGALNGQFRVASVNYSTVDHSAEYSDLSTGLQAARAKLDQLRTAPSPGVDPGLLAQQISAAEQAVSKMQGQSATITGAVQSATASIDISEAVPSLATAQSAHNGVLQAVLTALSNDASAVGWVLGVLLAVLPVAALVLLAWWVRRRWLRRSPA
jgi:hypothetical protein